MAITFVGASSIEVGSSVTLTPPAGYAEGDLLIIFGMGNGFQSITNPAGWIGFNPSWSSSCVISKFASSSESPVVLSPLSNAAKSFMVAYRGVDTTSPINSNTTVGEDPSTSMNSVTGSVSIENSLVIRYWLVENLSGGSVITPPASVNVRAISDATSTYKGLLLTDELEPNIGLTPLRTATQTTEEYWTARTIVLNPYVPPPSPITFVGASSVEVGSSVTLTPPAGYAEGDLLIIFAAVENNTPITDPAGWDGFSAFFTYIATKFASSSEAPVTVSLSTSTGKAVMLAYRGVEDITDGQIGIRFGTNMPSEIRYPAIENSLVFRSWTVPNNSSIITPPGSVNVRVNSNSTSTHRGILLTDELQPVPGASALRTATQTVNGSFDTLIYVLNPYVPPPQNPLTINGVTISPGITIG